MQKSIVPKDDELIDFSRHKRTLEERLDSIKIEPGVAEAEAKKAGGKLLRDKLAGLFRITDVINTLFKWNEETDKAIKSIKRDKLFELYLNISEENENAISQLKDFLGNPSGNALFNKIIRITDDNPPDIELLRHLSMALYNIVNSEFEKLFSEHKHALSQIERLTPQALTIMSDYANWPPFPLDSFSSTDGVVTSDWVENFSHVYASRRCITDPSTRLRISHAVRELHNIRLVIARQQHDNSFFKCSLTPIGNEIRKYILR